MAAIAAILLVWVSDVTELEASHLPVVFSAGVDGARAMLQAIAGSIITVAGVTFSITIVALQLTSTQFSPRVLRNFMRDRSNQVVLAVFMGTFTYTLLVLRSIRSQDDNASAFVPALAITGALVLTLVSLFMLIYFIHHISVRIQVTSIVASVAGDTLETIERLGRRWRDDADRSWQAARNSTPTTVSPSGAIPPESVAGSRHLLPAEESGYLQFVDIAGLVEVARDAGGRVQLLVGPGAWVQAGVPVAAFESDDDGDGDLEQLAHAVAGDLSLGHERSMAEDVAFGVQQLVDVTLKAISPSVNDPTTAMNCIDRLVQVLMAVGTSPESPRAFTDRDGELRLGIPFPTFEELMALSFDQVRHHGAGMTAVVIHMTRALTMLRSLPPDRHAAITRHAGLLSDAASASIALEAERRRALEAIEPLLG
jgi:uncharacterized membrane protein